MTIFEILQVHNSLLIKKFKLNIFGVWKPHIGLDYSFKTMFFF